MSMINSFIGMIGAVGDYTTINIIRDVLVVLMVVLSLAVIVIILMQKGTSDSLGAMNGTSQDSSETYMGKNKGHNKERKLKIITSIAGGLIVLLSILYFVLTVI